MSHDTHNTPEIIENIAVLDPDTAHQYNVNFRRELSDGPARAIYI